MLWIFWEIRSDEMNEIQEKILEIFKEVKKICQNNNITYFAIGGTAIGAVRHKGFIPWDDDLDIAVPIQDYDRFLECARRELPEHMKVYTCSEVEHYQYVFAKIHNTDTAFIELGDKEYPDAYKGIFVDVMPMAAVPDDPKQLEAFKKKLSQYYSLNAARRYPFSKMTSPKKKAVWLAMRPLTPFIGFDYYSEKWLSLLRKYPLGSTGHTGYTWNFKIKRLVFPKEYFASSVELPFEDTTIAMPVEYEKYLEFQFGDYMKLPPEDERAPHHVETISTVRSYKTYSKGEVL